MREYDGWSFRDRSFALALGISLLWHFFWFFSIVVEVSPEKERKKAPPRIVSLGAVLDDDIFRTLVETKPQLSEAFYRDVTDFTRPLEPPPKKIERMEPGTAVSVPLGKRFLESVKVLVDGDKASPDYEFVSRINLGFEEGIQGLEGEVRDRPVLSRPEEPQMLSLAESLKGAEVVIKFTVDASGGVKSAEIARSSGNESVDALWLRYVRHWRFQPAAGSADQLGTLRFRLGPKAPERA